MELNGIYSQSFDEQVPNGSHSTGSGSATHDPGLSLLSNFSVIHIVFPLVSILKAVQRQEPPKR